MVSRCSIRCCDNMDPEQGLPSLADNSVDAVVTDPPAGVSFMGADWDTATRASFIADLRLRMEQCLRVLKPGAHALVWALPRTCHWTMTAIEDAGFEIRDTIIHLFGCVPLETEILTARGWRRHDDLTVGEQVVQVDASGAASLGPLQAVSVYPFDGEMRQIETRSTLQLLTPGHTVHAYAMRAKWKRMDVDEQMTAMSADTATDTDTPGVFGWKLPLAARGADVRRQLKSVDHAELLGWVITEGHMHRDVEAVSIYQNEGPNADRIRALLDRLGVERSEYRRTRTDYNDTPRECVQWYLPVDANITRWLRDELGSEKPAPCEDLAWLPFDQALALFEALVQGDGSRNQGDTSGAWYQKRPEVRAWFQTLCFRLGYRSSENANKMAVSWARCDTSEVQRGFHRQRWASRVQYVGEVWCPTVPQGRWVARYRGHVFVTGNTGMPKTANISKVIDRKLGAKRKVVGKNPNHRPVSGVAYQGVYAGGNTGAKMITAAATPAAKQWESWGTGIKPGHEVWVLCRKPLGEKTIADNLLRWGTGALNIDGCRITTEDKLTRKLGKTTISPSGWVSAKRSAVAGKEGGRWPANITIDQYVAAVLDEQSGKARASRFYYCAKTSTKDKNAGLAGTGLVNSHGTVKSTELMRWLCRLVTPPGGIVLDPYTGSGSSAVAALQEGFQFLGMERHRPYYAIAVARADAARETA